MTKIYSHLTFSGNCREAMLFYKKCLGGKLTFQTLGESPMGKSMPPEMKALVLQASLVKDKLIIVGTDITSDQGLTRGNSVSLMLQCGSEQEIKDCYNKLSAGGKTGHPPKLNFQGVFFSELTDRYGTNWILYFSGKEQKKTVSKG